MQKKFKVILSIITISLILSLVIGFSYAYYVAFVNNDGNNKSNITSENLIDIELAGDKNITSSNLIPGESVSTTFTIDNQNNIRVCLSLIWSDVTNTFVNKDDLVISLKDSTGTELISLEDKQIFPSGNETLLATLSLRPVHKETYTLTITYQETDKDQSSDMGKLFKGTISGELKECPTNAVEYITELANTDDSLVYDETSDNNLRYIGSDPNNYVSIDGELWRIIGVMNNIKTSESDTVGESRIKLIRNESIGNYSWDTSDSSVNSGLGVNEWSQADLMKLLNPGYESESVGGSLYWNSKSGTCYNGQNNATTSCNFTSSGMKDALKSLIDNAIWSMGSNDGLTYKYNNIITSKFYELERSNNIGKICSNGDYCNDTVERTTEWTGKVNHIYASDYGYATSGGSTTDRTTCLNANVYLWDSDKLSDCKNENYLLKLQCLTPYATTVESYQLFCLAQSGRISTHFAYLNYQVYPTVYLSSSVRIISGDGTKDNAYVLGM